MAEHSFDESIRLEPVEAGVLRGKTTAAWANMVGPFGGMTAALMLRAIDMHPERTGAPLSLTVNFAAPIADGEFDVTARPLRTNRTNQHWFVDMVQDGTVTTTATAVFGLRRDTWSDTEKRMPDVPAPEEVEERGLPPVIAWARNYDMRFIDGAAPSKGAGPSDSSTTMLWARDRLGRPLDFAALTAASDIFYPRIYLRLGAPTPAGTISLTTYFHATALELASAGDDFVLGCASANRFSGGYFDQSAEIWSRSGTLLATTHQIVYFKT
ncbi:thioesterase family protein [Mycolicibacterium obuense]|uniref:Acyl-CoA thioesterase n=1 Tax=Mycolicibacterium obuense TaxID=1807 RepID=A0A0M2K1Y8_9MYCO|nr:thioesterase family protein [Mycolicibacterium obuense]KKF01164.1 acyl-CoA thioesterase [Mycolicibacterium obuense]TDL05679.1 thioesterase family protein [Mycolicibacterium obuense]